MDVLFEAELETKAHALRTRLARGDIAILPTDTIYGLSCNAFDEDAVARLNQIKRRSRPATIIPHDLSWARALVHRRWRDRFLPMIEASRGETLLFPLDPHPAVPRPAAVLCSSGMIAFRRPEHHITRFTDHCNLPLVTTSVNRTGEPFMTSFDDLDRGITREVDVLVFAGTLTRRPSVLNYVRERKRVER